MLGSKGFAAVFMPALLLSPPAEPGGGPAAEGGRRYTQTYSDEFGPEVGDWYGEQLIVPKFTGPDGAHLVRVEVQTCGQSLGIARFQNLDQTGCTFTYDVTANILLSPADADSPCGDFPLTLEANGGPFPLDPGQTNTDVTDTGTICSPVEVFDQEDDLSFFYASEDDALLVFDHYGITHSSHTGCGVVDFHSRVDSMLSVQVTYVYELGGNQPPICRFGCDPVSICQGGTSTIIFDAKRSEDPEKQPLTYRWRTSCPHATFTNPTGRTTLLVFDHGSGPCTTECDVQLTVSDGELESVCSDHVSIP